MDNLVRRMRFRCIALAVMLLALVVLACSTVPITGRQSLNIVPASTINSMASGQYSDFIQDSQLSQDAEQTAMIKRVGGRIQAAVEKYFADNNMSGQLAGYEWEFNLVEDSLVNAWCMPGGKVVFYTGILPICQDENGVAVVMGHEIAHAIANHGNERMSQGLLVQLGGMALSEALKEKPEQTRALFMTAFGIGANVGVLLPYSRLHESEADRLGLIFMTMAGYDPNTAVAFWQRMSEGKEGAPPEFLSTHPSDETRVRNLRELIPEAMQYAP